MRIVLIGPVYPYKGGIVHYTTKLAQALETKNHEVLLISFRRQYPRLLFPGKTDKDPSCNPLMVNNPKYWIDSINPITWVFTFLKIIKYKPDKILLQWWTPFWAIQWIIYGFLNRLTIKAPIILICHNVIPHETNRLVQCIATVVFKQGKYLIAQSQKEMNTLLSLVPSAKTRIFPHPIYDMFVGQKISKNEALEKLGFQENTMLLMFFGIVREYKGLESLLHALALIKDKINHVHLVIAGEFWVPVKKYRTLIGHLKIDEMVHIDDRYIPNEEVGVYFSAADLLIAPYHTTTASGVVQLARGFSLPCITTSYDKTSQNPDPNIILVESNNVETLAAAILEFVDKLKISSGRQENVTFRNKNTWEDLADLIGSLN